MPSEMASPRVAIRTAQPVSLLRGARRRRNLGRPATPGGRDGWRSDADVGHPRGGARIRRAARAGAGGGAAMRARLSRRRHCRGRRPAGRDAARRDDRGRRGAAGEPDRPSRAAAGAGGGAGQRGGGACARLRRCQSGDAGASLGRDPAGPLGAGRAEGLLRARGDHRLCRRLRGHVPDRHGAAAGPLRDRLSRHRHDRRLWRGGGLRPAPGPRRRGDGAGARHRRDPGGRAQIAVRHDVQAVPRRQGGAERAPGGAPRAARVFEPGRPGRMRPGLRCDPRPGFFSRRPPSPRRNAAFTSSPTSSNTTPPAT